MALDVVALGSSPSDRRRFLRAGMEVYRGDPCFVPELDRDLLRRTDPAVNPFFLHAEVEHLVAVQDGRDVGRVAAIRNRLAEESRGDRTGYFGWFECPGDPRVARALLAEAARRLGDLGCDSLMGPVSYSTNDVCGLLVEGFDGPPVLMMAYNPPWYEGLLLGAGLSPAEDLLAWLATAGTLPDLDRIDRIADRARKRHGWSLRPLRRDRFAEDLEAIRDVYNRAWEANWGFVPMTREEFAFAAADLRSIVVPEMVPLAEKDGVPVGFCLALPDFNQVLRHLRGSLFPLGWAKALWHSRRIDTLRTVALGVVPEARNQGIEAALYMAPIRAGLARGYRRGECSWTLARNTAITRVMESLGALVYRRYRLYRGPIPLQETEDPRPESASP